jgi:hypothetical protein
MGHGNHTVLFVFQWVVLPHYQRHVQRANIHLQSMVPCLKFSAVCSPQMSRWQINFTRGGLAWI